MAVDIPARRELGAGRGVHSASACERAPGRNRVRDGTRARETCTPNRPVAVDNGRRAVLCSRDPPGEVNVRFVLWITLWITCVQLWTTCGQAVDGGAETVDGLWTTAVDGPLRGGGRGRRAVDNFGVRAGGPAGCGRAWTCHAESGHGRNGWKKCADTRRGRRPAPPALWYVPTRTHESGADRPARAARSSCCAPGQPLSSTESTSLVSQSENDRTVPSASSTRMPITSDDCGSMMIS